MQPLDFSVGCISSQLCNILTRILKKCAFQSFCTCSYMRSTMPCFKFHSSQSSIPFPSPGALSSYILAQTIISMLPGMQMASSATENPHNQQTQPILHESLPQWLVSFDNTHQQCKLSVCKELILWETSGS